VRGVGDLPLPHLSEPCLSDRHARRCGLWRLVVLRVAGRCGGICIGHGRAGF